MEGNLKMEHKDIYHYIHSNKQQNDDENHHKKQRRGSWLKINDPHEMEIKLPLNQYGEITLNDSFKDFAIKPLSTLQQQNSNTPSNKLPSNEPQLQNIVSIHPHPQSPTPPENENEEKIEELIFERSNNSHSRSRTPSGTVVEHDNDNDD
eukprot:410723_1